MLTLGCISAYVESFPAFKLPSNGVTYSTYVSISFLCPNEFLPMFSQLPTYEEVMNSHFHKASIMQVSELYDGTIVDVGTQHLIVQVPTCLCDWVIVTIHIPVFILLCLFWLCTCSCPAYLLHTIDYLVATSCWCSNSCPETIWSYRGCTKWGCCDATFSSHGSRVWRWNGLEHTGRCCPSPILKCFFFEKLRYGSFITIFHTYTLLSKVVVAVCSLHRIAFHLS